MPVNDASIRQHRADVNGIRVHYARAGQGEPVVLLHGFPETHHAWRKVMPALAERFTVIAPDLRGSGDSDRPSGGYDKRTVASDVRELVRSLGLGPVRLVGHDVGMMVAYAYAASYPADVERLVLMEAALPGLGLEAMYDAVKYPRMYHLPLFDAPNGLAEALIVGRERMFVSHFMRQQAYDPTGLDEEALDEYARRLAAPGALRAGIEYFRSHGIDAEHNREHAKTLLPMPVLTVGGSASFGANLEPEIRPLARNLRSVMIEECGHYLAEEKPDRVIEELLQFLSEDEGKVGESSPPNPAHGDFAAWAVLEGGVLDDRAIRDDELARGRHALAYLKDRLGDTKMRELLAADIAETDSEVRRWVDASNGRWRSAQVELVVPGPPAAEFHRWYDRAMAERRASVLRAGHPEHFVLSPGDDGVEVVENVGETELPWRVFYRSLPDDALPLPWESDYPVRFGAEIVDGGGLRVGYTMHHARDAHDGTHLLLRTLLPEAAPPALVERHLHHFAIEFTNWTRTAWHERREQGRSGA